MSLPGRIEEFMGRRAIDIGNFLSFVAKFIVSDQYTLDDTALDNLGTNLGVLAEFWPEARRDKDFD